MKKIEKIYQRATGKDSRYVRWAAKKIIRENNVYACAKANARRGNTSICFYVSRDYSQAVVDMVVKILEDYFPKVKVETESGKWITCSWAKE